MSKSYGRMVYPFKIMHLLLKTFSDFFGSNGLHAFIESGVLLFFWAAVLAAITSSLRPAAENAPTTKIRGIVQAANFNYVATIVAGLVLTAATGAIGGKPSSLPSQGGTTATQSTSSAQVETSPDELKRSAGDPQKDAFQKLCGWSYIGLGIICLIVFVIPSPTTHDLVKTVGLTTLGFAATIIGGFAQ